MPRRQIAALYSLVSHELPPETMNYSVFISRTPSVRAARGAAAGLTSTDCALCEARRPDHSRSAGRVARRGRLDLAERDETWVQSVPAELPRSGGRDEDERGAAGRLVLEALASVRTLDGPARGMAAGTDQWVGS